MCFRFRMATIFRRKRIGVDVMWNARNRCRRLATTYYLQTLYKKFKTGLCYTIFHMSAICLLNSKFS